jgi:CHRD domain
MHALHTWTRIASITGSLYLVFAAQGALAQPGANFVAHLTGNDEVPEVDVSAQGQAVFQLDSSGTELSFRLISTQLVGTTQAHIHCGADGVNGPVVAFLLDLNPDGIDVDGVLSSGVITNADVIQRPDSPECPGGIADFDDLIARMSDGGAYVNVHTLDNPGGEIRGQIGRRGPG